MHLGFFDKGGVILGLKKTEKSITNDILRYFNKINRCYLYKRHGSVYNNSEPDISGVYYGYRVEIEVKLPGKDPTPGQAACLRRWAEHGAICGVARSLDDAKAIVSNGYYIYTGEKPEL